VEFAGSTDVGRHRRNNQDALLLAPDQALFGVADGMGGLSFGDVAAELCLSTAKEKLGSPAAIAVLDAYVADPSLTNRRRVFQILLDACDAANDEVNAESRRRHSGDEEDPKARMGATLDLCLLVRDRAFFAHVGDARAYLVRPTTTLQVTHDHALYDRLRATGKVRSPRRPARTPLVNAIGLADAVHVETVFVDIGRSDQIVLLTDGVHGSFDNESALTKLCERRSAAEVANALIAFANEKGGRDNSTAVVIQIKERFLSRPADASPRGHDLSVIAECPLVQDMPTWAILEMLAAGVEIEIPAGDPVPWVVAADLCAYVLVEGMVDLSDGRTLGQSALLFPECLVGVTPDGSPPKVREAARMIRIRSDDFAEVCRHDADLASGLFSRLARHLAMTR
jgi:serine/threonine protein phosphatase PrpC